MMLVGQNFSMSSIPVSHLDTASSWKLGYKWGYHQKYVGSLYEA